MDVPGLRQDAVDTVTGGAHDVRDRRPAGHRDRAGGECRCRDRHASAALGDPPLQTIAATPTGAAATSNPPALTATAATSDPPAPTATAATSDPPAPTGTAATSDSAPDLFELALAVTRARARPDAPLELAEAAAALQELASAATPDRAAELAAPLADVATAVQLMPRGPLLVVNPSAIRNHLGVDVETRPQMALCRCGRSAHKPLCDGSHADGEGFDDAKDPARQRDRLDSYDGLRGLHRQPGAVRALGVLLGPDLHGVPRRRRAVDRSQRGPHGRDPRRGPRVPIGRARASRSTASRTARWWTPSANRRLRSPRTARTG